MEDKRCPVFVDGKECGRPLTLVNLEGKKIARYDLGIYESSLGHRTYFLLEPKATDPSAMTREEIERKMDELARKYVEPRDPEMREEIYRLGLELEKMRKLEKQ
jgi:hypothetical protein